MSWPLEALRDTLGGSWDGDEEQAHGLVTHQSRALKIELTRVTAGVRCHIFERGAVIAGAEAPDVRQALVTALRQI